MTLGVDPLDVFHNGQWYSRGGVPQDPNLSTAGNTLCILGDSFDVRSAPFVGASDTSYAVWGIWTLTNTLLGGRFNVLNVDAATGSGAIQAGSGTPYAQRLQSAVLAYSPKWASIRASVNDTNAGNSYQSIVDAYKALFDTCNAAGIKIISNTIGPSTTANMDTTAKRSVWARFNEWIAYRAPEIYDIVVLPQSHQFLDPAALTGQCVGNTDLHPTLPYAFLIAKDSAAVLSPYVSKFPSPIYGLALTGTADETVVDPNPINIGTAGTLGVNVTGSVSTSFGCRTTSNLGTVTASKVARTDGPGAWQQFVWTPSAAGQVLEYYATGSAIPLNAGFAIGDTVQFFCEVEYDAATAAADVHYPTIAITFSGSSKTLTANPNDSAQVALGTTNWRGVVSTPKFVVPAGTTGIFISYGFRNKTTGAETVRIGQHGMVNLSRMSL